MSTKESHLVKNYVGNEFSKRNDSKETKWLPSVLAIMADLMDVHSALSNEEECRAVVVECGRTQCEWYDECARKRRQLYVYNENHKYIFRPANQLPNELRINNKHKKSKVEESVSEVEAHMARMKGEVIYEHFKRGHWAECPCTIEDYKAVMASIFFFCPDILWCAISEEMSYAQKRVDSSITQPITKSLEFYILLDKIAKEYGTEVHKRRNIEEAIVKIHNQHSIPEIEEMTIKNEGNKSANIDRILRILDAGCEGINFICRKMSASTWDKKLAFNVMGRENYEYLSEKSKTVF